ncbi:FecR family protein [bacterium]|nr:FecR family protein [bacterium]
MSKRLFFSGALICILLLSWMNPASAADDDVIALTLVTKGPADYSLADTSWTPLKFGTVLYDSTQVRTGEAGFAAMAFTDDGSQLKMRPNTRLTLFGERQDDNSILKRVTLEVGELFNDVKKQKGAIQISTPTSVASVKGTEYWLLVDPDGNTTLITLEGVVELTNLVTGQTIQVGQGYTAYSTVSGEMTSGELTPETTVPDWDESPPQGGMGPDDMPGAPGGTGGAPPGGPGQEGDVEEASAGGGTGLSMNGAVGAAVIDGETYQFFSLRPDIHFGKWGIGLDLSLYFDADGNLREEDWDSGADAIDKIYYLRYGLPGDPFFARVGSLDNVTLGFGMIMRRYSNAIEWPQVKRIGLHTGGQGEKLGVQFLLNNFREVQSPGLLAARATYETRLGLPVVAGATAAFDGNLYLGAKDTDDDGVPNAFDQFPDRHDGDAISYLEGLLTPNQIDQLILSGDIPDILHPAPNIGDLEQNVSIWGVDVGVPIIRSERMNLWVYTQMAQIVDFGRGYSVPGVSFNLGPFRAGAEYRIFEKEFMPEFFNLGYEVERVVWSEADSAYVTKKSQLAGRPSASGIYADAGFTFSNLLDVYAAYQQMSYDDPSYNPAVDSVQVKTPNKSLYAKASLNATPIPKLGLAEAYYQQPQADNIFDTKADGTTLGYRVGFEMAAGLLIVYDNKTIYRNGEPNKIMTVETVFRF